MKIIEQIRIINYKIRWKQKNKHNNTYIINSPSCKIDQISVGKETYGGFTILNNSYERKLKVGSYCSIGENVKFLVCIDHPINLVSTFPFKDLILHKPFDACSKGDIIIDDDVWIGTNAIILSGVHVGQGAVIGAGAVVTKDVPPYAVVGGVPASIIKYRFQPEIIHRLIDIDYDKLSPDIVRNCIEDLYTNVTSENVEELIKNLPKKSDGKKSKQ